MKPGIHTIPADQYHADPTSQPSLSASIAKLLCNESPLHAWAAHPKLNAQYERRDEDKFDLGTVCHAVFLEGQAAVELVDAPDWRTKAAQEERFQARVQGKTPLLKKQWPEIIDTVTAARKQLAGHQADPPPFQGGKPEQTLVWEEAGVVCRSRLDWLRDDFAAVDDLKFTSRSANPRSWSRTIFGLGYDIQAEMYSRGVERLTGVRPDFRLVVVEVTPPYAVSVISLAPDAATIARKKVDWALAVWRRCLDSGEWPGFADQVAFAHVPAWEEAAWLEQELEAVA